MRTAEEKKPAAAGRHTTPFFDKGSAEHFFGARPEPNTFFQKSSFPLIQPKLAIGQPNDKYEKEADAIAQKVVSSSEPTLQAKCAECDKEESLQKQSLPEEDELQMQPMEEEDEILQTQSMEEEEDLQMKPSLQLKDDATSAGRSEASPGIQSRINSSRGSGRPLDSNTRSFMESGMQTDFSSVNIHTGDESVQMNLELGARAFTVGNDIYFNKGEYRPGTSEGKKLLAHELTHTVQQNSLSKFSTARKGNVLQRNCGSREIGEPLGCESSEIIPEGPRYLFRVNCDEFLRGNELDLRTDAFQILNGETVEIHGISSVEGNPIFNMHLSCARALKARQIIEDVLRERGVTATILVFNHGPNPGNLTLNRSVVLTRTSPVPVEPESRCGPNATTWFINQVNAAKSDPLVLALKARLEGAERVARRHGFSAREVAEGAVAQKVIAEERRAGSPARTAEARSQLTGALPGRRAFARALNAAVVPIAGAPEALVLAAIRGAALTWKNLVGTGKIYDFKNSPRTLANPVSDDCPVNCANTITMCSATNTNCFIKDVPGNLFYAFIGRFVGWSELSLQLGSQFAQLDSSSRWDPPEDTEMIHFGFNLPDPLTEANLCSAIQSNPSVFDLQRCSSCANLIKAEVVPATI